MSLGIDILKAVGTLAAKSAAVVVKTGYEFGKATGVGTVKGTATVVSEVVKKATGN